MNSADWLIVLCTLNPCITVGDTLHVPVPEVAPRTPTEQWPIFNLDGFRVRFVPLPRSA